MKTRKQGAVCSLTLLIAWDIEYKAGIFLTPGTRRRLRRCSQESRRWLHSGVKRNRENPNCFELSWGVFFVALFLTWSNLVSFCFLLLLLYQYKHGRILPVLFLEEKKQEQEQGTNLWHSKRVFRSILAQLANPSFIRFFILQKEKKTCSINK